MPSLNILWLLTDEQRTDSLGCYGSEWAHTPCLDRLAGNGIRFESAYTPSPVCVSARAAMLTGQANTRLGVLNNHQTLSPERARFLTRVFTEAGYETASFGKHHYNCPGHRAFDLEGGEVLDERVGYTAFRAPVDEEAAGVVYYPTEFRHWVLAGTFPGTVEDTAEMRNAQDGLEWLRRRDSDRPFLLRLSFNAPHTPVVAPPPYDTLIDPDRIRLPIDTADDLPGMPAPIRENLCRIAGSHRLQGDQVRRMRQVYYGRVAFLDDVIGRFLEQAEMLGALENTLIVFSSDHGCHLADHGMVQKQSFYEASARVPFIVAGPEGPRGVVRTPVNVGSILPTCLDLAGLHCPDPTDFPSLGQVTRSGREPTPEPVFSEIDFGIWGYRDGERYAMVRDGDWKLALFRDPCHPEQNPELSSMMLHNLAEDPMERNNLARDPRLKGVVNALLERLDKRDRLTAATSA